MVERLSLIAKHFLWRERQIAKEKFYVTKKPIKIWDNNVDNLVISKLIKTKNQF